MKGNFKKLLAGMLTALLLITSTGFTNVIPEDTSSSNTIISEEHTTTTDEENNQINTPTNNEENIKDEIQPPNANDEKTENKTEDTPTTPPNTDIDLTNIDINSILTRYYNGDENAEDLINLRRQVVEKNNWQNFVDENYFLKDSFYSNKSGAELSTIDIGILTKPVFSINNAVYDEIDGISLYADVGNGIPIGTIGTNTQTSQKVGWDASGWGDPTYTNLFYTSFNGIQIYPGFCGAHDLPGQYDAGQQFRIIGTSNNPTVIKSVYYGYGGADGRLRDKYSPGGNMSQFAVYTALTISDYMGINNVIYSQKPNAYNGLKAFIADLNALPTPPSHFKAYIAEPLLPGHQPLVFLGVENPPPPPTGTITIEKRSADPNLTNGNDCYSLEGAKYGVWRDKNLTNYVGDVTTALNADKTVGIVKTSQLRAGTYYIKELKAPKGYAIDPNIYPVTVTGGQNTTLQVKDNPKYDPIGVLLRKVDSKTKLNKSSSQTATLEGAEFEFKFYKGIHETDPALSGQQPVRQWVFRTDKDGYCQYDKSFLVSGDELYMSPSGVSSLPIGTITIQETKSPEGFLLNDTIFVVPIKEDFSTGGIIEYVEPVIPENLFSLKLIKKQADKDVVIPNAVFEHTRPDDVIEEYTTDENGQLNIEGLQYGIHTIKEKTAPNGYLPNSAEVQFRVNEDNSIEILSNTSTDETGKITINNDPNNFNMIVEDKVIPPSLKIIKENNKGTTLSGAEFTLFADEQCTQVVDTAVSDSKGEIKFNNIEIDRDYWLMETQAPDGYKLPIDKDNNFIKYKIRFESIPAQNKFNFIVDDKVYDNTTGDGSFYVENNAGVMKVINNIYAQLPKTGSDTGNIIFIISTALMFTALILIDKRSKKYEN